MPKVLLVNGSPNEKGCTYTALAEAEKTLHSLNIETEWLWIGKKPVAGCIDCGKCYDSCRCAFDDQVNRIAERLDEFDALIVGSPVYYAGPSAQVCAFLDRLFYSNGHRMAGKLGAAVVSCRRGGATAAFDRLNKYFMMNNMPVVTSQYWNQIHGNTAAEALQDAEGLQTMRILAKNMAWLLRCIEAGKQNGIQPPAYERRIATNFIR